MDMFCSDSINELAGAMLKVQAEVNPAVKDGENPFAKARYATLNSVMEASREALLEHGLWLTQSSVPVKTGHLGLMTKLVHATSGQWQAWTPYSLDSSDMVRSPRRAATATCALNAPLCCFLGLLIYFSPLLLPQTELSMLSSF